MILFSTNAAQHLASGISLKHGACTIKKCSDGEIFVQIDEDVKGKSVFVLAHTQAPGNNILELFFLLDALKRSGAQINVFISYFGYARQIIAGPGQAFSAQVISTMLKEFTIKKLYIMHVHSTLLHEILPFIEVRDVDFFCEIAASYDAIAAPDKGALALAQCVAQKTGKELIVLTKKRHDDKTIEIVSVEGQAEQKKILLVDDMISTGNTIVQAAQELKRRGAICVAAAATHALFSHESRLFLESSILEKVFVTNTTRQISEGKIIVHEIQPVIMKIIEQL